MRDATQPLRRRYRTDLLSLLDPRVREKVYADTLLSQYTSTQKNVCAQTYATESGVAIAYPMTLKGLAGETATKLCREVGIPTELFFDNAKAETKQNRGRDDRTHAQTMEAHQVDNWGTS
jgi:hypothetical protein